MSKEYRLCCQITVSAYTIVDAESEAEALEIGKERNPVLYEGYGEEEASRENWLITEADGMPMKIQIEK